MADTADATRSRRSRLTPEREQEVLQAVLELVREHGYEPLTMDAVAARTKSSKATLYRQWESKPRLVATALRCKKGRVSLAGIDTGTLTGDLYALARAMGEDSQHDTRLNQALGHAVNHDPELHKAVREVLVEPEMAALDVMVRQAVERGELAADNPATPFLGHLLVGAMASRPIVEDQFADQDFLIRYLEAVILPLLDLH